MRFELCTPALDCMHFEGRLNCFAYVAWICGIGHFRKCLDFPQLPRHLLKMLVVWLCSGKWHNISRKLLKLNLANLTLMPPIAGACLYPNRGFHPWPTVPSQTELRLRPCIPNLNSNVWVWIQVWTRFSRFSKFDFNVIFWESLE